MGMIAGYDIGGAHLKVALLKDGQLRRVEQFACPLWRGVSELQRVLGEVHGMTSSACQHAVTLTGELADVFPDRYTGVVRIVEIVTGVLGPNTRFWIGRRGLGGAADAIAHHGETGSANFLATATIAARLADNGLLIDVGSTTTDIVPFAAGVERAAGLTDADRLRTGGLVYTGLTRTPVMAVSTMGLYQGHWQTLARDPFATMADVRRVLAELPDGIDLHATADGRGKSLSESRSRLARCFGRDAEPGEDEDWVAAARHLGEAQIRSIHDGALQVLSAAPIADAAPIVSAGIGAAIASSVAARLGRPTVGFGRLVATAPGCDEAATRHATAVAVAMLAAQNG